MANGITFVKGQGGLGRPLTGEDHISAYLHYTSATLPTGFSASDRIKLIYSVEEAEALGITNTSLGATASTATYQLTNKGVAADIIALTVAAISGTLTLASYTTIAADVVSLITAAAKLAAAVNAGTVTHGWSAVSDGIDKVTLTAPKNHGEFLNSGTPYTMTITGTTAGTLTQNVVTGVASDIDIQHYNISEYFRMQPKGVLYVGLYATSADFAEVTTMQDYSSGKIRQMGVYTQAAFATATSTLLQTQATAMEAARTPLSIFYQGDFSGVSDLTTLSDLKTLSDSNVTSTFGQDGAATGFTLWSATGKSIGCVGTVLGAEALARVSDSIAWVGKFPVAAVEFETLAFANGDQHNALTVGQKNAVDALGYVFPKKHPSIDGSYFNNDYTNIAVTSDYERVRNVRTIDKATRSLDARVYPALASPLLVNTDGTLTEDKIAYFESLGNLALDTMVRDAELSGFSIAINPSQNVLSTGTLNMAVSLLLVGAADNIVFNIGFVTSL